jgi:hypothetical protein
VGAGYYKIVRQLILFTPAASLERTKNNIAIGIDKNREEQKPKQ